MWFTSLTMMKRTLNLQANLIAGQGKFEFGLDIVPMTWYNTHTQDNNTHERNKMIKIENPLSRATQTYAISKASKHKHLMRRLLQHLRSETGQMSFANAGFDLMLDSDPDNE